MRLTDPTTPTTPGSEAMTTSDTTTDPAPGVRVTGSVTSYGDVAHLRSDLVNLADRLTEQAVALDDSARAAELGGLAEKLRSDQLRITYMGEFSRGKSALINAMLGRQVLPSWATPTTAILTEVHWGEEPRALVYHRDDEETPIVVDVDQLASYITVDEDDEDAENPYHHAVVEWPLEVCRQGVTCIDSPGLNDSDVREEITLAFLHETDVMVFVIDCTVAMSMSERYFLQRQALASGTQDLFFVGNKINLIEEEADRERVRRSIHRKLTELLGEPPRLYFVDARGALRARMAEDPEKVEESGVPMLEAALERYLAEEPGRRRLAAAARVLATTASSLRRLTNQRLDMLAVDREELRRRYELQREPLETLERRRDVILGRIGVHMNDTERLVAHETTALMRTLAEAIPGWADEFEPGTVVSANPRRMKERIDARVHEVVECLEQRVQIEFARWQGADLLPMLERRMQSLEQEIGGHLDEFVTEAEQIRCDLTFDASRSVDAEGAEAGGRERVFAAAAGFLLMGAGGAVEGGMFGYKGLVRAILPSIAAIVGLTLLHFGPWGIFTALLGLGALRGAFKLKAANEKIKAEVAKSVADEVRNTAVAHGQKLGADVRLKLQEFVDALHRSLEEQILDLRREVETVLAEHELSEEDQAIDEARLRRQVQELEDIEHEASEVFAGLAKI
jgi:hypothetical protein